MMNRRKFLRGLAIGLPATAAAAVVAPLLPKALSWETEINWNSGKWTPYELKQIRHGISYGMGPRKLPITNEIVDMDYAEMERRIYARQLEYGVVTR